MTLPASCKTLLTNMGCSSVYETNLFLHPKKFPHMFCSAEKKIVISGAIKTGSGGKFHLTEKMLQLWPPGFCSFLSDSFQDM